ncbi:lethal (2) essential for life [Leptinotarsa decemlineata]|uniref:lethal (2) essential for life n=1 Tax=Leptinotarsa decemlineata TaxID=7539 RepID=UPI000C252125|nr:protein lethal(2)essential for life [Leptinotarsa decemlineata]
MSVVPLLFRDWWDEEDFVRPSRLLDQQFGLGLRRDDLLSSLSTIPRRSRLTNYIRPWNTAGTSLQRQESASTITQDKDKFQVILDVQQFAPSEITVKTTGNSLIVEGKHEEKQDEHGYISRHFVRRYVLPETHDVENVVSSLSSDGILTVSAPKKAPKDNNAERVVPITKTGPAKASVQSTDPQPKVEHPTS